MTELTKPPKRISVKDAKGSITCTLWTNGDKWYYVATSGWKTFIHDSIDELLQTLNKYRDTFEIVEE